MDPDISRWLLDFIVRQPIEESTLTSLISTLPLSDTDSNLKKLLLLRKLRSHISSPTLDLLSLLEHFEELDHRDNVNTLDSIKRAYCAVAVHFTLLNDTEFFEFDEAVENIWSVRVGAMLRFGNVGLVSDELIRWKEDFEKALGDCDVRKGLLDKWKCGVGVVEALRDFVDEANKVMGPSFIEFATQTLDDGIMMQLFGMEETHTQTQTQTQQGVGMEETQTQQGIGMEETRTRTQQDIQTGTVHRRSKVRAAKQYKKMTPKTSRGVKIVDYDELSDASLDNNYGCLSTPEVTELQEKLRSSTLDLQKMVKDPLPEALEMAKNVASKMDYVDKRANVIPAENSNLGNKGSTQLTNATKVSLMERNETARTYEWDEPSDGSADLGDRPHLCNLKNRLVTLKKPENSKPLRRKRKYWSKLEEDTLRAGVQKYGMGNWKVILTMHRDIFDERTEVDLKDKWRNMMS